jgi:hypothetical protein
MSENNLDKTLIYINNTNSTFLKGSYITKFLNPIKDVLFIKVLKADIKIANDSAKTINTKSIKEGDNIYLELNDYSRLTINFPDNSISFFEYIQIGNENKMYKNEYSCMSCNYNDVNTYNFNPVESNLSRLELRLYDKEGVLIKNREEIEHLSLTLCIYSNQRKISMV